MGRANIIMRLWTISHTGGGCRATRFVMGKQFDGIHKQIFVHLIISRDHFHSAQLRQNVSSFNVYKLLCNFTPIEILWKGYNLL